MSLSLAGVCRGSALVLLHGIRPAGVKNGICTPVLVFSRLSLTLCNRYSSSKARLGLSRHVASRLRWANEKYEKFLQRRFPRFYVLYHTFMTGFRLLFQNAKEVRIIKTKMISNNVKFQNLSYREMETLRQFRRDMIKAIPLVLISIPPFANYLVFVLMYLFPRQLLIRHFWTPGQQVEFQRIYHSRRAENHAAILTGLTKAVPAVRDGRLQSRLLHLCNKVQSGSQPSVPEIQAVKGLFSGPPLGMKRLDADHMVCSQNAPSQPISVPVSFAISHRLRSQALELLQLDRALHRLGVHELSESELRQACYLRGVDSSRLSVAECQDWLIQWLKLSNQLKESETSLLLHSMVLLSANSPKPSYL